MRSCWQGTRAKIRRWQDQRTYKPRPIPHFAADRRIRCPHRGSSPEHHLRVSFLAQLVPEDMAQVFTLDLVERIVGVHVDQPDGAAVTEPPLPLCLEILRPRHQRRDLLKQQIFELREAR